MYVYGSLIEVTLSVVKQLMTYNTSCILLNTSKTNQCCVILFTPITAAVYYIFIISVLYIVYIIVTRSYYNCSVIWLVHFMFNRVLNVLRYFRPTTHFPWSSYYLTVSIHYVRGHKFIVHLNTGVCSLLYLTYMYCECEVLCTWSKRLKSDRSNILIMNSVYHVFTCIVKLVYILVLSACLLVSDIIQYSFWKFTYKQISIGSFFHSEYVFGPCIWAIIIIYLMTIECLSQCDISNSYTGKISNHCLLHNAMLIFLLYEIMNYCKSPLKLYRFIVPVYKYTNDFQVGMYMYVIILLLFYYTVYIYNGG